MDKARAECAFQPVKRGEEDQQRGALLRFKGVGPTSGGTSFGTVRKSRSGNELLMATSDPKSDIPFFYIKLKEGTAAEKEAAREEWGWISEHLNLGIPVAVNPYGKSIESLKACVKHKAALHSRGTEPTGQMLKELKKLGQKYRVRTGLNFGKGFEDHKCTGLPWEKEKARGPELG